MGKNMKRSEDFKAALWTRASSIKIKIWPSKHWNLHFFHRPTIKVLGDVMSYVHGINRMLECFFLGSHPKCCHVHHSLVTTSAPLSSVNSTGWNPDNRNILQTTRSTNRLNTFLLLTLEPLQGRDKHRNGVKEGRTTAGKWQSLHTLLHFPLFVLGNISLLLVPQEVGPNPESLRLSSVSRWVFAVATVVYSVAGYRRI